MAKQVSLKDVAGLVFADDVIFERVVGVSPDNDSKTAGQTKQVTVRLGFGGVSVESVLKAAMSPKVIAWQRTARSKFNSLPKEVNIHFTSAGQKDPKEAMLERAKGMSKEDLAAYIAQLQEVAQQ